MRFVAGFADVLSLIPGMNFLAIFIMWLASQISGVPVFSSTSPGVTIFTVLTEFIWPLSMLPMWSIRTHFALKELEAEEGV